VCIGRHPWLTADAFYNTSGVTYHGKSEYAHSLGDEYDRACATPQVTTRSIACRRRAAVVVFLGDGVWHLDSGVYCDGDGLFGLTSGAAQGILHSIRPIVIATDFDIQVRQGYQWKTIWYRWGRFPFSERRGYSPETVSKWTVRQSFWREGRYLKFVDGDIIIWPQKNTQTLTYFMRNQGGAPVWTEEVQMLKNIQDVTVWRSPDRLGYKLL